MADYHKYLSSHVLVPYVDTEPVKGFRLKHPKYGRMEGCLILFTEEGIAIMGDLTPGDNGCVSCFGYDLAWFSNKKDEDYLCSKFLRKKFVPEIAVKELRKCILENRRGGYIQKRPARLAWQELSMYAGELDAMKFHEIYWDLFEDTPAGMGWDYDPRDAGLLCAIQHRFAELYAENTPEAVPAA